MTNFFEPLESRTHLSTVTWDGGGGDFSWHNPLNWSGDVLPTLADDVVIDGPLAQPITHSDPGGISLMRSLTLHAPLEISGGTFRVEVVMDVHSALSLSGGMLSGTADIFVHDEMLWTGGSLRGFGELHVPAGGQLEISGDVILARNIFVESVMHWASGNLIMAGATVRTQGAGVLEANSTGVVRQGALTNMLQNAAITRRTAEGRGIINVVFDNTGTLEVKEGALSLWGPVAQFSAGQVQGGTWRVGERAALITTSGPLTRIAQGATVILESRYKFGFPALAGLEINEGNLVVMGRRHLNFLAAGFTNQPTGVIEKYGEGTHSIATQLFVNLGTIRVHSGILRFAGGAELQGTVEIGGEGEVQLTSATMLQQVSISGLGQLRVMAPVTWASGTIGGVGKGVIIGEPGTLTVQLGTGTGSLARQLINHGTVVWEPGSFTYVPRIDNFGVMRLAGTGGITRIVNHGKLTLASAGVLDMIWLISSNRVEVTEGDVRVSGWATVTGLLHREAGAEFRVYGRLEDLVVSGEGTLRLPNTHTLDVTIESGTVVATQLWSGGALRLGAATLINNGVWRSLNVPTTVEILGGPASIQNNGTWTADDIDLRHSLLQFTNNGTVTIGQRLSLLSTSVTQLQGNELLGGTWKIYGELDIEGGAVEINRATLFLGKGASFAALASLSQNYGSVELDRDGPDLVITPAEGTLTNHGVLEIGAGRSVVVNGDLTLSPTSMLRIHIWNTAYFGLVSVTGLTTLGGEVEGLFFPQNHWGYVGPGERFNFLATTELDGEFATVSSAGLVGFLGFEPTPAGGALFIFE